jgi:hypothetical protein
MYLVSITVTAAPSCHRILHKRQSAMHCKSKGSLERRYGCVTHTVPDDGYGGGSVARATRAPNEAALSAGEESRSTLDGGARSVKAKAMAVGSNKVEIGKYMIARKCSVGYSMTIAAYRIALYLTLPSLYESALRSRC